jgi:hypothetical protein
MEHTQQQLQEAEAHADARHPADKDSAEWLAAYHGYLAGRSACSRESSLREPVGEGQLIEIAKRHFAYGNPSSRQDSLDEFDSYVFKKHVLAAMKEAVALYTHPVKGEQGESLAEYRKRVLGTHNAWPLPDVLQKLIEATEILLLKKDYDGPTWEEMSTCAKRGKEIIAAFYDTQNATGERGERKDLEGENEKLIDAEVVLKRALEYIREKTVDDDIRTICNRALMPGHPRDIFTGKLK